MIVYDYIKSDSSYDAFLSRCSREGRRRNPTNWAYDSVPQPQYMHRGYTFHEMLDEFGLINMNGRCYDPVVGRFLSPDIVVQNPNNTQCYNRYSYAVNNPLKYTDPSGWSWTPIQAANHANMMAMTMTMRLQDNFHPTVIRSGSSSRGNGFLFGSNAIVFQNAEATLEMALGEIAHILSSVFGMPGVFGNQKDDDPGEHDPTMLSEVNIIGSMPKWMKDPTINITNTESGIIDFLSDALVPFFTGIGTKNLCYSPTSFASKELSKSNDLKNMMTNYFSTGILPQANYWYSPTISDPETYMESLNSHINSNTLQRIVGTMQLENVTPLENNLYSIEIVNDFTFSSLAYHVIPKDWSWNSFSFWGLPFSTVTQRFYLIYQYNP